MVHDGPSVDGEVVDETRCHFTEQWKSKDSFSLFISKSLHLRNSTDRKLAPITPYFAHPPYLQLLENLRGLLNKYNGLQDGLDLARSGGVVETNHFPKLEEIYSQYLSYLDAAILQLQVGDAEESSESSESEEEDFFEQLLGLSIGLLDLGEAQEVSEPESQESKPETEEAETEVPVGPDARGDYRVKRIRYDSDSDEDNDSDEDEQPAAKRARTDGVDSDLAAYPFQVSTFLYDFPTF